jgi:hypothetical protein
VLGFLDFSKPFEGNIDVSGFAIGGLLMQEVHPNVFESKKLSGAKLMWSIHRKPLFTKVSYLKTWQHYFHSQNIKAFMNNVSLRYFEM